MTKTLIKGPKTTLVGAVSVTLVAACGLSSDIHHIPETLLYWSGDDTVSPAEYVIVEDDDEKILIVEDDISLGTLEEALLEHNEILALLAEADEDADVVQAVLPIPVAAQGRADASLDADEESDEPARHNIVKAIVNTRDLRRWRNGTIRYRINPPVGYPPTIDTAINNWNAQSAMTGLTWVLTPNLDRRDSGVRFDANATGGCNSKIGRFLKRRDINLGCGTQVGTIMHEMGHAMGLYHEQVRESRNRWIAYLGRNYTGARGEVRKRNQRPRIDGRGRFDPDSIMQYFSNLRSRNAVLSTTVLPTFLSRLELSRNDVSLAGTISGAVRQYNPAATLGFRGLQFENVIVADVDFDGLDDIVADWDDALYFASAGQIGWQRILPGGQFVNAKLDRVEERARVGDFDGDGEIDVIKIQNRRWTLFSSASGTQQSRDITVASAMEVTDINADGIDDIIALDRTGHWWIAMGPDPLQSATVSEIPILSPQLATRFKLANMNGDLQFVTSVQSQLFFTTPTATEWLRLFPDSNLGQFDLARVNFIDIDSDGDDDLVLPAPRGSLQPPNTDRGHPVFIADPLSTPAPTAFGEFTYVGFPPYGIDLRAGSVKKTSLVGRFAAGSPFSFLSFGQITGQGDAQARGEPAWSDILGIATNYDPPALNDVAALADRHPVAPMSNRDIRNNAAFALDEGEYAELWATFMTSSRLRSILVEVARQDGPGGPFIVESDASIPVNKEMNTVEFAFGGFPPAQYEVRMTPEDPGPLAANDSAIWDVQVIGCGDGQMQPGEMCDDGNRDPNDGCNNSCQVGGAPDPIEDMPLWRASLRLQTCDRDDASTNANLFMQWLVANRWTTPFYLNKPGNRELNRRQDDSYDLPLSEITTVSDIEGIALQIEGKNAWCLQRARLVFNGNSGGIGSNTTDEEFFSRDPGDLDRWLDGNNSKGRPNRLEFNFGMLRGDRLWNTAGARASALTAPTTIAANTLTTTLMHAIGDELERRGRVEWEGGQDDVIFKIDNRTGSTMNIGVDIDLERDRGRRGIDADFVLAVRCEGGDYRFETSDLDIDHRGVGSAGSQARRAMEIVLPKVYGELSDGLSTIDSIGCANPVFDRVGNLIMR